MAERGFLDQAMDFAEGVVGTLEAVGGTSNTSSSSAWRIVETIRDNELFYVVTNDVDECSCTSRELAEKVLRVVR